MTAARDGVDRFGTPSLSTSNTPSDSRVASPPPGMGRRPQSPSEAGGVGGVGGAGNLNENLRNIGKFFRRDVGSFGRFGGRSEDG